MGLLHRMIHQPTRTAVLVDPEKTTHLSGELSSLLAHGLADEILVGGSTADCVLTMSQTMDRLRACTPQPLTLFPGSAAQLDNKASDLILPVLISGRNPDYLIGHHVTHAHQLSKLELNIIPTGYILIGKEQVSATARVTDTPPIDPDNIDLVIQTAIAGSLIGLKAIYLEGGSGSDDIVPPVLVESVKQSVDLPIIVGGGIDTAQKYDQLLNVSPNMIVIGNALESNPQLLRDIQLSTVA